MATAFSLAGARFATSPDVGLRDEIRAHTGSDAAVTAILRCIERFGGDPSIRHYEMTPTTNQRTYRGAAAVAWSVRAVRPEVG
jgi:hypothetical protein